MNNLPGRSHTHVIGEKACNLVNYYFTSDDWITREITAQDYGADAIVEHFQYGKTTSEYLILQVKGTESDIDADNPKFPLEVKTLRYSEMFSDSFLLIYASVNDFKKCYFIWLQDYIRARLDIENPDWRKLDSDSKITVYFPKENQLCLDEVKYHLAEIAEYPKMKTAWLKYYLVLDGISDELVRLYTVFETSAERVFPKDKVIQELNKVKEKIELAINQTQVIHIRDIEKKLNETLKRVNNTLLLDNQVDICEACEVVIDSLQDLEISLREYAAKFDDKSIQEAYKAGVINY